MPTLEDLSALKNENIRKALRGFIAVAKMGVIPPTAITTSRPAATSAHTAA